MADDEKRDDLDVKVFTFAKAKLLPPPAHLCQKCGHDHPPELPHNQETLYWHMWFHQEHGRYPTWEDAMAHCTPEVKEQWKFHMAMVIDKPEK